MRFSLDRPPRDDDELWELTKALWGVEFPRKAVCHDHVAPFSVFADAFFARAPQILLHGSRGLSGKSFMMSNLGITQAVILGCDVNILGGSFAQSKNVLEHMSHSWSFENAPRYMLLDDTNKQQLLANHARIRPLTASQRTVRGPHPAKLLLDEIDEMDQDILNAAYGQPMPQKNWLGATIPASTLMVSTWQRPDGCLAEGTKVTTRRGDVPIEKVRIGDQVVTREGWRSVQRVFDNGVKECVRVTLASGREIICTPDHEVLTSSGWVEASSLLGSSLDLPDTLNVPSAVCLAERVHAQAALGVLVGDDGVRQSQVMPVVADSLCGSERDSSLVVDCGSDRLQVVGVHTHGRSTEVIERQVIGDRPSQLHPDPPVGEPVFPDPVLADVLVPVPLVSGSQGPEDALRGLSINNEVGVSTELDRVVSVSHMPILLPTYDLRVEGEHEYVANGVFVHNCMSREVSRMKEAGLPVVSYCYKENLIENGGWLDPAFVEQKRLEVPKAMWEIEYELGEPSIGNRAIDSAAVERMFDVKPPVPVKHTSNHREYSILPPQYDRDYVISADWAQSKDWTVICVFDVTEDPIRLAYFLKIQRQPYPKMIGMFNYLMRHYNAIGIHDATGLGSVVSDLIDDKQSVTNFVFAGRKRDDMLSDFIAAVENDKIRCADISELHSIVKYCVAKGSLVRTLDGSKPIEQIKVGELVWTRAGLRPVTAFHDNGVRPLHRLRTSEGHELLLTPDHLVATPDGWVRADALEVGDMACVGATGPAQVLSDSVGHEVFTLKGVTPLACQRLGPHGVRHQTSSDVFGLGDHFQVMGVDTGSDPAQMVKFQPFRDWLTPEGLEGNSMSHTTGLAVRSHSSITQMVGVSLPDPASVGVADCSGEKVSCVDSFRYVHITHSSSAGLVNNVYDLTVEGEHEYLANGIVVHNCSVEDIYSRSQEYHLPDEIASMALAWHLVRDKYPIGAPWTGVKSDDIFASVEADFDNNRRQGEVVKREDSTSSLVLT